MATTATTGAEQLELELKVHEVFTIMEKAPPNRAFSWLKVPTTGRLLRALNPNGDAKIIRNRQL